MRQVAGALAPLVRDNAGGLHGVLKACVQQGMPVADGLAVELVATLQSPDRQSLNYLLQLLDGVGKNGKKRFGGSLRNLFEKREAVDDSPNTQHVYARSCNYLRSALFKRATAYAATAPLAAEILFDIEEHRFMLGRPADETRHPNINSKLPWPQCLADAHEAATAPESTAAKLH